MKLYYLPLGLIACLHTSVVVADTLKKVKPVVKDPAETVNTVTFKTETVIADAPEPIGVSTFNRQLLNNLSAGNGDITSVLKLHPNIQFDDAQLSSKTPGEIAPANISINGAHFYQNAFLIDGISMNNDLDPAEQNPNRANTAPGRSQGLAIDTDLLEQITVYDSNVPAAYGHFTGGVIEAKTRAPSKDFQGKISAQMSRSAWTKYHIHEAEKESFALSSSADNQPDFVKYTLRATLEGHLSDNFGLMASFNQKNSKIPLGLYSAHHVESMGFQKHTQRRQIDNYFIKGLWQAQDNLSIEFSSTYAPEENDYFAANSYNSGVKTKSGGYQHAIKAIWDTPSAQIEQNLAYSRLQQSRDSDENDFFSWRKSTSKFWGPGSNANALSLEGGHGDIKQQQEGYQYNLAVNWQPLYTGAWSHSFSAGIDANWKKNHYQRLTENSTYVSPKATNSCQKADGSVDYACAMGTTLSGWDGQYATTRTRFIEGEFSFNHHELGAYVENLMTYKQLSARAGLRLDRDSYMQKTTVAPRLLVSYDLFADNQTILSAGANRYYGRNISSWRLRDGLNRLRFTDTRKDLNAEWVTTTQGLNTTRFNQLDIPYDDELTFGLQHHYSGVNWAFKYVYREGKDQVIEVKGKTLGQDTNQDPTLSKNFNTYTNQGQSRTEVYTLTAQPELPLLLGATETHFLLALDWSKSKSSSPLYSDTNITDTYFDNPYIQYDGKFIRYADRPADNYHRPWTARLNTMTHIEPYNLSINNFFRYRAGYSNIAGTGKKVDYQGELVNVWQKTQYADAWSWDMRLSWELPLKNNQAPFINIDIFNVLDRKVVTSTSNVLGESVPAYEVGRQFWVEVGYKF